MVYRPEFTSPAKVELCLSRNVISEGEDIVAAFIRLVSQLETASTGPKQARFGALQEALLAGRLVPSSQMISAAGRAGTVAACTVLPTYGTTDGEKLANLRERIAEAARVGLGTGIDVSEFDDPRHALCEINAAARELNRELVDARQRPPALMVSCSAKHPRVSEFYMTKKDANLIEWVANISVMMPNDVALWNTHAHAIAQCAHGNGEPGLLFPDIANDDNPTPQFELRSTAPCAEVFLAENERCVFFAINLAAHVSERGVDWELLRDTVNLAVLGADAAVDLAEQNIDSVVRQKRRIGIGLCGYHSALILMEVPYASSAPLAWKISETILFQAHYASAILAQVSDPFPAFTSSRWREDTWRQRKFSRVGQFIPKSKWHELSATIAKTGIRNSSVTAFPPTGVSSDILGVSKSYEPHFSLLGRSGLASNRDLRVPPEVVYALSMSDEQVLENLDALGQWDGATADHILACARQIPVDAHLAVHEAFSILSDESAAKTVNLPNDATIDDTFAVFENARSKKLKGVTVFRDGSITALEA